MFIAFDGKMINVEHIIYAQRAANFIELFLSSDRLLSFDPGCEDSRTILWSNIQDFLMGSIK